MWLYRAVIYSTKILYKYNCNDDYQGWLTVDCQGDNLLGGKKDDFLRVGIMLSK